MSTWNRTLILTALALVLGGCEKKCNGPANGLNTSDLNDWEVRLEALKKEYHANREKLLSDWRIAVAAAQQGELDADKLAHSISDLIAQVREEQTRLDSWTRELEQMGVSK